MSHEHEPQRSGAVAVDIGPGRGALVIRTGAELCGTEIELSPAGDDERRQHVWVLQRDGGAHAAVFGSLAAGRYRVWRPGATAEYSVATVHEGTVAELDLRFS